MSTGSKVLLVLVICIGIAMFVGILIGKSFKNQVLTTADKYEAFSTMMVVADSTDGSPCCTVLNCAVELAQNGMDVVPQEDRWREMAWSPPVCGSPAEYYIVEIRYAVMDTLSGIEFKNITGDWGMRVAAVGNGHMSLFTDQLFSDSFGLVPYGIEWDVEQLPCIE